MGKYRKYVDFDWNICILWLRRPWKHKKSPRKKQHYIGELNRERWKENEKKKTNIQNKEWACI